MQAETGICEGRRTFKGCGKKALIVNRTHWLCDGCNRARLGKPAGPVMQPASFSERLKTWKPSKPRKRIKPVSEKQKKINAEMKESREAIHRQIGDFCTGCHRENIPTDDSHYLSRHYRPDLELEPDNRTRHCRECHNIWESGTLKEKLMLKDFAQAIAYVRKMDRAKWVLIMQPKLDVKKPG